MTGRRSKFATWLALPCVLLLAAGSSIASGQSAPTASTSVIGGSTAYPGEFPFMAYVYEGARGISCSGSVVAPRVVLTAAHCVTNFRTGAKFSPDGFRVTTGNVDWTSAERQESAVTRVARYPRFSLNGRDQGFGDAALLQLATPTTAVPLPLASGAQSAKAIQVGTRATVAGWGITRPEAKDPSKYLIWTTLVIEGTRCEGLFGRICAIDFPRASAGVCHGDSGGPLLARTSGAGFVQIGISQAVYGHCSTRRPGVFMRIDAIGAWLHRQIHALE